MDVDWWFLAVGYGVMAAIVYSLVYWIEVALGNAIHFPKDICIFSIFFQEFSQILSVFI